jgi:hypothetical protein
MARFDSSRCCPDVDRSFDPIGNGYRSDVTAFPEKVYDRPMVVSALQMLQGEMSGFRPPQSASKQDRENRMVPLTTYRFSVWTTYQIFGSFRA